MLLLRKGYLISRNSAPVAGFRANEAGLQC